jgi:uncharacterized repeat protein (TIGR01451 family)
LVAANVAPGASGSITNTTNVSGFQTDTNTKNNDSHATIIVVPPPVVPPPIDIQVIKHVNHATARFGQVLTYTLDVKNNGPGTAPSVKVTDSSGAPLKVLSIKPSQGTCTTGVPFTCTLGAMGPGKTAKITIRAIPKQSGTTPNAVSSTGGCTSAGACPHETNLTNNLSHAQVKVSPYLTLTKTVSRQVLHAGDMVTYHIKVTDPTSAAIRKVTICDTMPAGLTYVSSAPRAHLSTGRYCWSISKLVAHSSKTYAVLANALPGATHWWVNQATASAPGVRTVHAHARVRVIGAPRVPCGIASAASVAAVARAHHSDPVAHKAC